MTPLYQNFLVEVLLTTMVMIMVVVVVGLEVPGVIPTVLGRRRNSKSATTCSNVSL
jgi:hypothetical protein